MPVTAITTGKLATPDPDEEAMRPTDATVPYTGAVEPVGTITAWSPTFSCPISVSSTDVLTVKLPVDITVTPGVEDPDEADDEFAEEPARADNTPARAEEPEREEELAPDELLALELPLPADTESPTARPTEATVPLKGAFKTASDRFV